MSQSTINSFEELLDDGEPSRRCDAWLAENIAGEDVKWDDYWECYKTADVIVTEAHPVHVKPFTTGDSIDPILDLAKDYFIIVGVTIAGNGLDEDYCSVEAVHEELGQKITVRNDTEQLAIAEALFKGYQRKVNN